MRKTGFILIVLAILTGCTTPRQMALFTSESSQMQLSEAPEFVIDELDILELKFYAVDADVVAMYNSAGSIYHVDKQGMVEIPAVGKVKVAGLTIEQAQEYLQDLVRNQVVDPIVHISIKNAAITILGEVRAPLRFSVSEPMAFPQAIGVVGGFTKNANLKDVLIQRSVNGTLYQYHINLLTDELFASPCYYLQKGDVVNIMPLHAQ